jgi:hypothetical protein
MIRELVNDIVSRGKENFLRAIPLGVTMDSHLAGTIAQIRRVSNPKYSPCLHAKKASNLSCAFGIYAELI